MRTKNFSITEVAHRPITPDLIPHAAAAMQHLQTIRDQASKHFGRDIPIRITSGYRELAYNRSLKSKDTSYHIWRTEDRLLWAVDFEPLNIGVEEFWDWYKHIVTGERYYHSGNKDRNIRPFIHTAPNGVDKTPWRV